MNELQDTDLMGKHRGIPMQDVPAKYLHWLWENGASKQESPVPCYIRKNLEALKVEYPDGIWT